MRPVAKICGLAGLAVLAAAWLGPLPALAGHAFAGHMILHVSVVAIAAPLLALGLRPWLSGLWLFPLLAAFFEFVVMWGWHLPVLHAAARTTTLGFLAEQSSFLAAGTLMWAAALAPGRAGALAGAGGLLLTSMHVTLLGALLTLSSRPLYIHGGALELTPLDDQALGGMIMLAVGTPVYLIGGLLLMAQVLREDAPVPGDALDRGRG